MLPPLSASCCSKQSHAGADSTPRSYATWIGSALCVQPWRPQHLRQVSGSSFSGILLNLLSRTLSSQFLIRPPARPDFLSRDTATCIRVARFPCRCVLVPSLVRARFEFRFRMRQHPRVYRFSERSRLTPSNCLTSWLSRQVLLPTSQAASPLSRTALALLSSWGRTRTVSFYFSRDSGAYSGLHATPAGKTSTHFWFEAF